MTPYTMELSDTEVFELRGIIELVMNREGGFIHDLAVKYAKKMDALSDSRSAEKEAEEEAIAHWEEKTHR